MRIPHARTHTNLPARAHSSIYPPTQSPTHSPHITHRTLLHTTLQDRMGGRAFTDMDTFGMPVDMGAMWIHGIKNNPVCVPILKALARLLLQHKSQPMLLCLYGLRATKNADAAVFMMPSGQQLPSLTKPPHTATQVCARSKVWGGHNVHGLREP
jgi:hypothetical protein